MPGAGGESWSMQRKVTPQLQQAASAGDPGAIDTMRRLNPTWAPVIKPRGSEFEGSPRLQGSFEDRMGLTPTQPPIASPGTPQGHPNLFEIASPLGIRAETDSMGIRWAISPEGYRVSIPKGIADADIESYATPKLEEQAQIHKGMTR